MTWWRRLFGMRRAPPGAEGVSPSVSAVIAEFRAQGQACLRLAAGGRGGSRLGGIPGMAAPWPRYQGRALGCIAQLDLSEIRAAGGPDWLPDHGRLLFFFDVESGSWGLHPQDAGAAAVVHDTGEPSAMPEPEDLSVDARFQAYPVSFAPAVSYPSEERLSIDWSGLNEASVQALEDALLALAPAAPMHQIGGYPCPVQNDAMEADCDRMAKQLGWPSEVGDWRLLLQLDTDDEAGMMWCDVGSLYFWIREQDARAGDFSRIWMMLQSN